MNMINIFKYYLKNGNIQVVEALNHKQSLSLNPKLPRSAPEALLRCQNLSTPIVLLHSQSHFAPENPFDN